MAILNGSGDVVGIVDPFDPLQPNLAVPALTQQHDAISALDSETSRELPFVLSRPSAAASLNFTEADLFPLEVRNREFFRQLLGGVRAGSTGFSDTSSPWSTVRSLVIVTAQGLRDEPFVDVDTSNDDICEP
jgi:hypothetical protein